MMLGELSLQGALQLWDLMAQPFLGQIRQLADISLASNQRFDHLAPRHSQHVGGNRSQLDIGRLQHLLNAIGHRASLLQQLGLLARQIAQIALLTIRHKTRLQKPALQQLRDPLRVLHVGLASRHFLDVLGVYHPHLKMTLEDVKNRLPVHPRRFHCRVRDLLLSQPLTQLQKIGRHRTKPSKRALHCAILHIQDAHTRHHHILVYIHPTHSSVDRSQPRCGLLLLTHCCPPFLLATPGDFRLVRFSLACSRGQTTRRHSEAPMEIPDHTPSRALPLQSLIGLFSGATDYLLPDLLQFSFSRGVRQHMKHSFENWFKLLSMPCRMLF